MFITEERKPGSRGEPRFLIDPPARDWATVREQYARLTPAEARELARLNNAAATREREEQARAWDARRRELAEQTRHAAQVEGSRVAKDPHGWGRAWARAVNPPGTFGGKRKVSFSAKTSPRARGARRIGGAA